ncbi:B12-binding domain-containing radical SAM protein [bacterium]
MGSGKRALLVNPWIVDFAAYDFWLRPLGLLWLGAFLGEAGLEVDYIDCLDRTHGSVSGLNLKKRGDGTGSFLKTETPPPEILDFVPRKYGRYGIPVDAFRDELDGVEEPDIILVTCSMTYWYPGAFEVVGILKERFPKATVALGGRYATLCEEHALRNSGADVVLPGPPGSGITEFVKDGTGADVMIPDSFQEWPAPAHGLHPDGSTATILFSAGCPFRCSYCVSGLLNEKFETRPVESIVSEIEKLIEERRTEHFAIYDDALLACWRSVVEPVLDHVIQKEYKINFYTPNALHARYIISGVAEKMKRAGFSHLRIGYESAEEVFQRETGGKVTNEQFENAVGNLLDAGYSGTDIGAYIIFGHPDQTAEEIERAIRKVAGLGVEPVLAEYSPIPGSRDFDKAVKTFKYPPDADPLLHNSSLIMYQHPKINRSEMESLKKECMTVREKIRNGKTL